MPRPPRPPFDRVTADQKVLAAEAAWNTRDLERVAQAHTVDTQWHIRDQFVVGREEVADILTAKWQREQDCALRKQLWAFTDDRIAVRFQYEWHDCDEQWWRSHGNEMWEFSRDGLMYRREASINDIAITESDRRIHGPRPVNTPVEFGLR